LQLQLNGFDWLMEVWAYDMLGFTR